MCHERFGSKRIKHGEEYVVRSYDLIKRLGTPFKENYFLVHLTSGLQSSSDIQEGMVNAEKKGNEALGNVLKKRNESSQ